VGGVPTESGGVSCGGVLAAPDAFYRKVVEGMRCAIITVDREGHVLTINQLAREILELRDEFPPLGAVEEVFAAHPRLAAVLRDSLEMSFLPNRAELEIRSREEDGRTIGFTISPIPGDDGPEGIALFFKDLTQVERQEERERLRDRLAALGEMAASLAHEIRNPLASIEVTATLLTRKVGEENGVRPLVEKIAAEVERLNRTVTGGLEFARAITPARVEQPIPPLLDAALEEARSRFPRGAIAIERVFDAGLPPAMVDGHLLRQAFANVIANALEAMGETGRLTLEARRVAPQGVDPMAVEVTIRDSGPGIAAEVREKIFHPFVTTKKGGSGIGLAMARKIVECHHGRIDVRSSPGEGTAFRIRIPCRDA